MPINHERRIARYRDYDRQCHHGACIVHTLDLRIHPLDLCMEHLKIPIEDPESPIQDPVKQGKMMVRSTRTMVCLILLQW